MRKISRYHYFVITRIGLKHVFKDGNTVVSAVPAMRLTMATKNDNYASKITRRLVARKMTVQVCDAWHHGAVLIISNENFRRVGKPCHVYEKKFINVAKREGRSKVE